MGAHDVPRGETGTYTAGKHKGTYTGKHREDTAKGSSAQQKGSKKNGE